MGVKRASHVLISISFTVLLCCASAGQWRPLYHLSGQGMKIFDDTDYAFKVVKNLKYCKKRVIKIQNRAVIRDYGQVIQIELMKLAESGGGTVLLPAGILWMHTQIEVPSYCCIQGAGMYKTVLKVHPRSPPYALAGTIRTAFSERVSFFDFTQDGNRNKLSGSPQNRFGIYTHLSNYVWMKNVRIINNMWFGFDPHGAVSTQPSLERFLLAADISSTEYGMELLFGNGRLFCVR